MESKKKKKINLENNLNKQQCIQNVIQVKIFSEVRIQSFFEIEIEKPLIQLEDYVKQISL